MKRLSSGILALLIIASASQAHALYNLVNLSDLIDPYFSSQVNDINDNGWVVGDYNTQFGAFIYTGAEMIRSTAVVAGHTMSATGINNSNHVVGWANNEDQFLDFDDPVPTPFGYFLWEAGHTDYLQTNPNYPEDMHVDIDESDNLVIGRIGTYEGPTDLFALIESPGDWISLEPVAMNVHGQIIANGILANAPGIQSLGGDNTVAVLLNPVTSVPEPSMTVLFTLGTLGILGYRARRK